MAKLPETQTERDEERSAEKYAVKHEEATLNIERIKSAYLAGVAWVKERQAMNARIDAKLGPKLIDVLTQARIQELEALEFCGSQCVESCDGIEGRPDPGDDHIPHCYKARAALSSSAPSEMLERVKRLEAVAIYAENMLQNEWRDSNNRYPVWAKLHELLSETNIDDLPCLDPLEGGKG